MIEYLYMKRQVVIATSNRGKLKEYKDMLEPLSIECLSLKDIGYTDEIEENGSSFFENSMIKAIAVRKATTLPVIADDSGLSVDALNGEPGIYSSRYAGEGRCDKDNIKKLLENLHNLNLRESPAHFTCVITYIDNERTIQTLGRLDGKIISNERGYDGFGYDPIFEVDSGLTLAEMGEDEKNAISHRHNALQKLIEELK
jgi:XTP/dITP diphosphohydrolase